MQHQRPTPLSRELEKDISEETYREVRDRLSGVGALTKIHEAWNCSSLWLHELSSSVHAILIRNRMAMGFVRFEVMADLGCALNMERLESARKFAALHANLKEEPLKLIIVSVVGNQIYWVDARDVPASGIVDAKKWESVNGRGYLESLGKNYLTGQ